MQEYCKKTKRTVYDKNSPFSNLTVGLISLLFGPIPGVICAYISLENLGYKLLARISLVTISILSFIVYYFITIYISNEDSIFYTSILIGVVAIMLNLLLQGKYVSKWKKENGDVKFKSGYVALMIGILSYIIVYILVDILFINNNRLQNKNNEFISICKGNLLSSEADELNSTFNKKYTINEWCALEKLGGGGYKKVPNGVYKLLNLKELRLSFGLATDISKDIGKLKNLEILFLFQGHLNKLPKEILELKKLKKLILSGNGLKEIPNIIYKLESLEELYIGMNEIKQVSHEIGNLKNLTVLDLEDNNFDEFPLEITNLKNLKEFYFRNNNKLSPLNKNYSLEEKNDEISGNITIKFNEKSGKVEIILID